MVEQIYAKAGLPMTDDCRAELNRFTSEHPRGKHGRIVYQLDSDFGITPDTLRQRFDFYFQQFPVQAETGS